VPVAAVCPVCGELRAVPRGFRLADHLRNVHGRDDLAAALELEP
jgi:hypothetical protein